MSNRLVVINLSQFPELDHIDTSYFESSFYKLLTLMSISGDGLYQLPSISLQGPAEEPVQQDEVTPPDVSEFMDKPPTKEEPVLSESQQEQGFNNKQTFLKLFGVLNRGKGASIEALFGFEAGCHMETFHHWKRVFTESITRTNIDEKALKEIGFEVLPLIYHKIFFNGILNLCDGFGQVLLDELHSHNFYLTQMTPDRATYQFTNEFYDAIVSNTEDKDKLTSAVDRYNVVLGYLDTMTPEEFIGIASDFLKEKFSSKTIHDTPIAE